MNGPGRWVLLAYQLPREPSTPRVSIWRKLRRLGAAQVMHGLVALPHSGRKQVRLECAAAEFVFVGDPGEVPSDATPFDMPGVELSHHRGNCSFESFLERYELEDPVLVEIARIVHEADLADESYDAPEAPGVDVLIRGLS